MSVRMFLAALLTAITLFAAPAPQAAAKKAESKAPTASQNKAATKAHGPLLDINSASADELKALPGIGDAFAAKIIQNRPYRSKDQLVSRKVIPEATYQKVKDQIIAKQTPGNASKTSKKK
jgi:competence protein ComEA